MKKTLLIILALCLVAGVAEAKKNHKKKKANMSGNIESVMMHRTACFGRCPDYVITIASNGMATYAGVHFTTDSGVYNKSLSTADVKKIFDEVNTFKVDTCQDEYTNRIPDAPGIVFTIKYKDKTKEIHNAQFGPQFLKEIAKDMDAIGKPDGSWKKASE